MLIRRPKEEEAREPQRPPRRNVRPRGYGLVMVVTDEQRRALELIGSNGANAERLREELGDDFDVTPLLRAGYAEQRAITLMETDGTRLPPQSVRYYALTRRGATEIGLDPDLLV